MATAAGIAFTVILVLLLVASVIINEGEKRNRR